MARAVFQRNDCGGKTTRPAFRATGQSCRSQYQGNHSGVFADDKSREIGVMEYWSVASGIFRHPLLQHSILSYIQFFFTHSTISQRLTNQRSGNVLAYLIQSSYTLPVAGNAIWQCIARVSILGSVADSSSSRSNSPLNELNT